jgi:hypothetical protein
MRLLLLVLNRVSTVTVPFPADGNPVQSVYHSIFSIIDGDTVIEAVVAPVLHK